MLWIKCHLKSNPLKILRINNGSNKVLKTYKPVGDDVDCSLKKTQKNCEEWGKISQEILNFSAYISTQTKLSGQTTKKTPVF